MKQKFSIRMQKVESNRQAQDAHDDHQSASNCETWDPLLHVTVAFKKGDLVAPFACSLRLQACSFTLLNPSGSSEIIENVFSRQKAYTFCTLVQIRCNILSRKYVQHHTLKRDISTSHFDKCKKFMSFLIYIKKYTI